MTARALCAVAYASLADEVEANAARNGEPLDRALQALDRSLELPAAQLERSADLRAWAKRAARMGAGEVA